MTDNFWQGNKIRLRAIEPSDADFFIKWNLNSERARNLDFVWPPVSEAAVIEWVGEQTRRKLQDDSYHWIIEDRYGVPVGSIDTHTCNPRNGTFSYGVFVDADYTGKGYASEAIYLILKYYFGELRYQKVTVPVHSNNERSMRLHERLGFKEEGRHRRMVYSHGSYVDVLYYGMTAEEFEHMQLED